jgi:glycosyltransferase involved in cell wall biosynthesis
MADSAPPLFTIVVPTFSRPDQLRECLSALAALDTPDGAFEVVVVNDGGPIRLDPLVAEFEDRLDLRLLAQHRTGPGPARNAGAAVARGRYLAFLDDDCRPATGWLTALAGELARGERRLVGGSTLNASSRNRYAEASEHIAQFVYDCNLTGRVRERFFRANNIAMRADLFRDLGGFTASIPSATAEDKEFCDRWTSRGLTLQPVPGAVVYHSPDLTFSRFVRQHYNYGRGILAFRRLRRLRMASSLVPERFTFYAALVCSPFHNRTARKRWRLAALVILAQLATMAGAAREALQRDADGRVRAVRRTAA